MKFSINGSLVTTPEINWGDNVGHKLNLLHVNGHYQIWHKPSNCLSKKVKGKKVIKVIPAKYLLVKIDIDEAEVIEEALVEKESWAELRRRLIRKCEKLANGS